MTKIPDNYRRVKSDDKIRTGDLWKRKNGSDIGYCAGAIGNQASQWSAFTFWRKRMGATPTPAKPLVKTDKPKNVVVVRFSYNDKYRNVQLISLDNAYLKGLEITVGRNKPKYQFKTFLRSNIGGSGFIHIVSYGPANQ